MSPISVEGELVLGRSDKEETKHLSYVGIPIVGKAHGDSRSEEDRHNTELAHTFQKCT